MEKLRKRLGEVEKIPRTCAGEMGKNWRPWEKNEGEMGETKIGGKATQVPDYTTPHNATLHLAPSNTSLHHKCTIPHNGCATRHYSRTQCIAPRYALPHCSSPHSTAQQHCTVLNGVTRQSATLRHTPHYATQHDITLHDTRVVKAPPPQI